MLNKLSITKKLVLMACVALVPLAYLSTVNVLKTQADIKVTTAEIDGGKAAIANDDDPLWAGALTVTASTATLNKLCLRQCPRRPQWRLPTTPEATAAIYRISPIHAASHRWPPDGG